MRESIVPGLCTTLIVVHLGLLLPACAPAAEPLEGPLAVEVNASIDSGTSSFDHRDWDQLLFKGIRDGFVDYLYFQKNRIALDNYLDRLAKADLDSLSADHLKALLMNAYNAYTIQSILDHPEVTSIKQIDGVWKVRRHTVGGHEVTLDEIEHNLLRPFFKDPRIHFGINCASKSCAALASFAFDGDDLDRQLDDRTQAFLRDSRQVRVENDTLVLSSYFDWFAQDFTAEGWHPRQDTITAFVAEYSTAEVSAFIKKSDNAPPVKIQSYDWSLNAAVPPDPNRD